MSLSVFFSEAVIESFQQLKQNKTIIKVRYLRHFTHIVPHFKYVD